MQLHDSNACDYHTNNIKDKFDQPGFSVLKNLEDIFLKVAWNEDYTTELEFVLNMYNKDFDASKFKIQLELHSIIFLNGTRSLCYIAFSSEKFHV